MKQLLKKEFRLAMHPTNYLFLLLSAMLVIPNYPYYVIFFYTALGLFFLCLNARETHDIPYTMVLPVRKRELVKARILFAVAIELSQFVVAIPFAILRQNLNIPGNQVGMDANLALFGLSLLMMGLFNLTFFPVFYGNPNQVGKAFIGGSTVVFFYIVVAEAMDHAVPFFRDQLDTPDPQFFMPKLFIVIGGAIGFALCNMLAYKLSAARFEKLDL